MHIHRSINQIHEFSPFSRLLCTLVLQASPSSSPASSSSWSPPCTGSKSARSTACPMAAVATVRKISAPGSGALAAPPCRKLGDLGADFWVIFWHFPRAKSTRNGTSMGNMRVFFFVGGTICSEYQEAMEIEYIDPPSKPWQQSMVESLMPSALQTSPSSSGRQERTACCWHRRWPWQKKAARNAEKSDAQTLPKRFDIVGLGRSSAWKRWRRRWLEAAHSLRWAVALHSFRLWRWLIILWYVVPRFWVVVPYNIYILYIYMNIYIINYKLYMYVMYHSRTHLGAKLTGPICSKYGNPINMR